MKITISQLPALLKKVLLLLVISLLGMQSSIAQTNFPERPVRLIVGYPPGGAADFVGRVIADQLSKELGVSVVVENKPGAGGAIAADLTAKANPDGYTISMSGPHAQIRALYPKMALDFEKDFIPISNIATGAMIICTNPQAPYKNIKELIQFAKANPEKIFNASSGNGSTPHIASALFSSVANVKFSTIQFKGGGPAAVSTIAGDTQLMFATPPTVMGFIKSGSLKAIALTSAKASPAIPGIPGAEEEGLAGFNSTFSYGIYAPVGTPAPIVQKIFQATQKSMSSTAAKDRLASQGMDLTLSRSPEQFLSLLKAEAPGLMEAVRASGAKLE
jgi:tripartite-type tricarboxylate transporter receptor subunit TctC